MNFYRPPAMHEALEAIGSIYRALRAWQFYPTGHPVRRSSIVKAYGALREILGDHDLCLNCGRSGFSLPDGEELKDSGNLCNSLSFELFIRRAKTITFLHDLRQEDLLDLVRLLTVHHDELRASGGMDTILEQHGVSTIWVNEFDLSIIHGKRKQLEAKGVAPPSLDDLELASDAVISASPTPEFSHETAQSPEQELQYLLTQLISSHDEERYPLLVKQAVLCAELLISRGQEPAVVPLLELLVEHSSDTTLDYFVRQNAESALEQLAASTPLLKYVVGNMEDAGGLSVVAAVALLRAAGVYAIVPVVEAVGVVKSLPLRRTLNSVLVDIGEPAVPTLLSLMDDDRWYIVRNLCAVLGAIDNRDALPSLLKCLNHADIRVCKEAVRSIAKFGGASAENALIAILKQGDSRLMSQVMASLGGMKSKKALVDFLIIVCSHDLFLKNINVKCEALSAIALIGEPMVAPKLAELLHSRFLLAGKKGLQFRIAIAECLGKLCNPSVIADLQKYKDDGGELGRACALALETLQSRSCRAKEIPGRKSDGSI